jgi:micrococcal nuclease
MSRLIPFLIVAAMAAAGWWWAHASGPPPAEATVSRVVDGDTVWVRAGSRSLDVRLLGIDTPETVDPHRPVGCFGPEASAYTKHLLTGRRVRLVYDRQLHDRYGRWLAYIYLERPRRPDLFVNARLVSAGYAVDPAQHRPRHRPVRTGAGGRAGRSRAVGGLRLRTGRLRPCAV